MTTADPQPHPEDDLVLVAAGQPVPDAVRRHVDGCDRCTAELAGYREVVGLVRDPAPELVPPPPGLWEAVRAEIDDAPSPAATAPLAPSRPDATVTPLAPRRAARAVGAWWLAAAAAVGVVVGGAGVGLLERTSEPAPPVVLGEVTLDTLDTGAPLGEAAAVRVGDELDLDVQTPRLDPGPGYLEVWLINRDGTRMVSLGVLRPGDGTQRFAIDQALIDQGYVVVDISREGYDDQPQHSGDSVARGTLAL